MERTEREPSRRIYFIDYLKAFSILMVIITHYEWENDATPLFTLVIDMAVPIFMLVSGYNLSMSYNRRTDGTLRELYSPRILLPRSSRFLLPFAIIYPLEMLLHIVIKGRTYTAYDLVRYFFRGGLGPGSYYVPVIVAFVFVLPLIYLVIQRYAELGVCIIGLIHLLFEIYVRVAAVSLDTYRLSFMRYLLYVGLGCYLFWNSKDSEKYKVSTGMLIAMFLCGLSFSLAVYQFGWKPPIFRFWTSTSLPMALYVFPIIYVLMYHLKRKQIRGVFGTLLVKISQASYHIFLVQMVYYRVFEELIFPSQRNFPVALILLANVLISLVFGYGFCILEKLIRKETTK